MKAKAKQKTSKPEYPKVYETFNPSKFIPVFPSDEKPSAFNGVVTVERYRVIIEKIEEPVEAIHERLEKLWRECDNIHHWEPLKSKAKEYGYFFKSERGCDKKRRQ